MIIGTVYKNKEENGHRVLNVPYKKHDIPCEEGCCENMLSIGTGTALKVSWLLKEYMPKNGIEVFDFYDEWSDELDDIWHEKTNLYSEKIKKGEVNMDFGKALEALKEGKMVKRYSEEEVYMLKQDSFGSDKEEDVKELFAHVNYKGEVLAYITFTPEDLLAEDWQVFEGV